MQDENLTGQRGGQPVCKQHQWGTQYSDDSVKCTTVQSGGGDIAHSDGEEQNKCHDSFNTNICDLIEKWEDIQGGNLWREGGRREEVGLVQSFNQDKISLRRPVPYLLQVQVKSF